MPVPHVLNKSIRFYIKLILALMVAGLLIALFIFNTRPGQPPESAIGPGAHMGLVEIYVSNPETVGAFYINGVGLQQLSSDDSTLTLGIDDTPLLQLTQADAPADTQAQAGLYHSAFLFPTETALAAALERINHSYPSLYEGASDHRVSLAFYYTDPEGNGVELYVDRSSDQWQWSQSGEVTMGSLALDANAFVTQNQPTTTSASGVTMGHVHLRVGSLVAAEEFFVDALGFAVTSRSASGALFFSANGYHHHIGTNTWSSSGAGMRPESLGLGRITIHVTREEDMVALEQRLNATNTAYERLDDAISLEDPWGNVVVIERT